MRPFLACGLGSLFSGEAHGADAHRRKEGVPVCRPSSALAIVDRNASNEFEGEIREFIRRDVTMRRNGTDADPEANSGTGAENLNSLIERVSGATVSEIDRLISELQGIRTLRTTKVNAFAARSPAMRGLSQSAVATMKVIGDTLSQPKPGASLWKPPRNDHLLTLMDCRLSAVHATGNRPDLRSPKNAGIDALSCAVPSRFLLS